jgi:hypothetical protein
MYYLFQRNLHLLEMFVTVCSLCFLPFSKYFKWYILLMNIYINVSTHIIFKNCRKNHTLPYLSFIGNEKILYVKLVCVVCTAQHNCMGHFILLFWSLKAVICPRCTHLTFIHIKRMLPPFWTSCTDWRSPRFCAGSQGTSVSTNSLLSVSLLKLQSLESDYVKNHDNILYDQ